MKTLSTALMAALLAVNASAFGPPRLPCPEKQVLCTLNVVTVREKDCLELKLVERERICTPEMTVNLLQSLKACPSVEFLTAPRMMVLNGQQAEFTVLNQQNICTGMTVDCLPNGTVQNVPKLQTVEVGLNLQCRPTIAMDGTISMTYNFRRTLLDDTALLPVTTMITPVYEGGSQGPPLPFTTFMQAPSSKVLNAKDTAKLSNGCTLWTCLGSRPCNATFETKLPLLGDLPFLGNLFCNSASTPDVEYTFALMTVKVLPFEPQTVNERPVLCCPPTTAVQACPVAATVPPQAVARDLNPRPVAAQPSRLPPGVANLPYLARLFPEPAQCPLQACPVQSCPAPALMPSAFAVPVMPPQIHASSPQMVPAPLAPVAYCTPACCPVTVATPPAKNDTVLKVLLEQYDVACKAGDTTKAKAIAAFCLEMDPACFVKK